jgi:hypothetical protein
MTIHMDGTYGQKNDRKEFKLMSRDSLRKRITPFQIIRE